MKKQITIRLDQKHEQLLDELAQHYELTRTQLVIWLLMDKNDEVKFGFVPLPRLQVKKRRSA